MKELIPSEKGVRLDRLLQENGLSFSLPCGGNHACGKCKLQVQGQLDALSPTEQRFLTPEEIRRGFRLACCAHALGPVRIQLDAPGGEQIWADAGTVETAGISRLLSDGYGAAIDIGTTTVVCALYASDGTLLGTESRLNSQQVYGADVISRINLSARVGHAALHDRIIRQVEEMLSGLCRRCGVPRGELRSAVATGNTTMLHFFAGLDPSGIGTAPFTPQSLFGATYPDLLSRLPVYLPPCVSAYVGADMVCCLLSSSLEQRGRRALLIDIGTNGEMVLFSDGALTCCSTAAGPAFEGSGISCGSIAQSGAIFTVSPSPERQSLFYDTIDRLPAKSICGSGVIEALSAFGTLGLMDETGLLQGNSPFFRRWFTETERGLSFCFPGSRVHLTQEDVRQIQLAKAAIAGGIQTLLDSCHLSPSDLDTLCLCGGFGSSLHLQSAEHIGLIPPGTAGKAVVLGNAALKGAAMALLCQEDRQKLAHIAQQCRYIELSTETAFMSNYIDAMAFFPGP